MKKKYGLFWSLWKKDMYGARAGFAFIGAGVPAWSLFLVTRRGQWSGDMVLLLSLVPLLSLPFVAIVNGVFFLSGEWRTQSIQLLRTLPVRSASILGGKLLTLYIQIVLLVFLVCLSIVFLWDQLTLSHFATVRVALFLLSFSAFFTGLGVLSQFAYIAGKMVQKASWLVSLWVFLLSLWGVARMTNFLLPLFAWVPSLSVHLDMLDEQGLQYLVIDTTPLGALAAALVFVFLLGSWLLDKHVYVQQ